MKIEAKFSVGEYDIVILSAKDSGGLDSWLREEKYKVPAGAEPFLRPYVQRVASSSSRRSMRRRCGSLGTPPCSLRFASTTTRRGFAPDPARPGERRGRAGSLVHVLAKSQRYEVANYPNVAVPTNLEVRDATRQQFPAFYAALFDRVLEKNPKAIVTEYSWQAGSCDPCQSLRWTSMRSLCWRRPTADGERSRGSEHARGLVRMTRLHARYTKESLGADLVFRAARGIVGGREHVVDGEGLERGAVASEENNFQARYVIRQRWEGPIACENPVRNHTGADRLASSAVDAGSRRGRRRGPRRTSRLRHAVACSSRPSFGRTRQSST